MNFILLVSVIQPIHSIKPIGQIKPLGHISLRNTEGLIGSQAATKMIALTQTYDENVYKKSVKIK